MSRLLTGRLTKHDVIRGKELFSSSQAYRHALDFQPASYSAYEEIFPHCKAAGRVKFTTHLHLEPILKINEATPPVPHMLYDVQGTIYLYFTKLLYE
jgi:hypothetical protein